MGNHSHMVITNKGESFSIGGRGKSVNLFGGGGTPYE
jgi:hypothetical protein